MIELLLAHLLALSCPTPTAWVDMSDPRWVFPVCGDEDGNALHTAQWAHPGWNPLLPLDDQEHAFNAFNERMLLVIGSGTGD